jgi:hypothetical protein
MAESCKCLDCKKEMRHVGRITSKEARLVPAKGHITGSRFVCEHCGKYCLKMKVYMEKNPDAE